MLPLLQKHFWRQTYEEKLGNRLDKREKKDLQGCQPSSRHSTSPFECRVLDVLDNNSPHTALSKQSSCPQCNPARVSPKHGANPSRATPQVTNVHLHPPSAAIVPRYLTERFGLYIYKKKTLLGLFPLLVSTCTHLLLPCFLEAWSAASPSK